MCLKLQVWAHPDLSRLEIGIWEWNWAGEVGLVWAEDRSIGRGISQFDQFQGEGLTREER